MSPYRALVRDSNDTLGILASMLSIDKDTGVRRIFIVEKTPINMHDFDVKVMAHRQTTKSNSVILGKYEAIKNDDGRTYSLDAIIIGNKNGHGVRRSVTTKEYTLQDCLAVALSDFCVEGGMTIVNRL